MLRGRRLRNRECVPEQDQKRGTKYASRTSDTTGALTVVVVDVLADQRPELAFIADDRAVQQFMAQCADPPFSVRVHLGR